jgi:hypothetical protein
MIVSQIVIVQLHDVEWTPFSSNAAMQGATQTNKFIDEVPSA